MGTGAGLFEVKKIGDEYFTFVTECKDPKACTILLRGASKEILAVRAPSTSCRSHAFTQTFRALCALHCMAVRRSGPSVKLCLWSSGGGEEPAGRHAGVS